MLSGDAFNVLNFSYKSAAHISPCFFRPVFLTDSAGVGLPDKIEILGAETVRTSAPRSLLDTGFPREQPLLGPP